MILIWKLLIEERSIYMRFHKRSQTHSNFFENDFSILKITKKSSPLQVKKEVVSLPATSKIIFNPLTKLI